MTSIRFAAIGLMLAAGVAGTASAATKTWQGISQNVVNNDDSSPDYGSNETYSVRFTFDDGAPIVFNNYATVIEMGFDVEYYDWAYFPNFTSFEITGPRFNVTLGDEAGYTRVSTLRFARRQGGVTGFSAHSGSEGFSEGYVFDFNYWLQGGFASAAIPGSLNIANAFENGFVLSQVTPIDGSDEFESREVLNFRFASGNFLPTAPTGAVPEPATWAMMIAGFGLAGAGLRRQRRRTPAFA